MYRSLSPSYRAPFRLIGGRVCVFLCLFAWIAPAQAEQVLVFAAASTRDAVLEAIDAHGGDVVASFAASSTLARQIENGAPAALFLSANAAWMDRLDSLGLLQAGSRQDRLGNRLALLASPDTELPQGPIVPDFPLADWLGDGRLALADPDHVPAGRYARAALESLGVWQAVARSSVRAPHVRAALALIERGETPLGIVYESDARVCASCQVVGILPADSHPPIRYPLALIDGPAGEAAHAFHAFLLSETAAEIFRRHGFAVR
ncbi:MAG: molybdate ABC transporter substrate-binding protein [Alphaproteobacteria bacterium]|jgi:molybdate transport system substrate-binding protein|nr:molybdate ABC transporter substrate-binding protein [Alphaproteobacteria bacterium]